MRILKKIIKIIYKYIYIIKQRIANNNRISIKSSIWRTQLKGRNIAIHENTRVNNCVVESYTYVGRNSYLANCKIGKYCSIGPGFTCAFGRHPINKFVSTHPFFYSKQYNNKLKSDKFDEFKYIDSQNKTMASIGNDVWIGTNVIILDGVKVGDGAVIGAGTIVTKDVPPYSIVVGVPGRIIKYRFSDKEIDFLLKKKWWDKEESWIKKNGDFFEDIEQFMRGYNNE